jgi:hypothetical protein
LEGRSKEGRSKEGRKEGRIGRRSIEEDSKDRKEKNKNGYSR